jgi:hypothetical protein
MPDYQLSKIYKLHCILENDDEPLVYYGSTTEPYLSRRLAGHIRKYKCYLNNKEDFITSFKLFEKYGLDNVLITLVESYPCNSKIELHSRERFYIENNKCCNKYIPNRSREEWKEINKDQLIIKKKEYIKANKDYFNEIQKEYRDANRQEINEKQNKKFKCECNGKYNNSGKKRHLKSNKHITYLNSLNNNI